MDKTAKITQSKFVSEWAGPNGIVYYHELHLSNGDTGQIGTKEKNPDKLKVGNELTYTLESSTRGNKIKAVSQGGGGGGGFKGRPVEDPKHKAIGFAAAYTKDLIVAGKLDIKDFEKGFERIYNIMIAKL